MSPEEKQGGAEPHDEAPALPPPEGPTMPPSPTPTHLDLTQGGPAEGQTMPPPPTLLDLTQGDYSNPAMPPPPPTKYYDPMKDREKMRGKIALVLVAILGIVVVGSLVALSFGAEISTLKELLGFILGPVVALVGSVTGFYFGGINASDKVSKSKNEPE
jgi:hypothetical protein